MNKKIIFIAIPVIIVMLIFSLNTINTHNEGVKDNKDFVKDQPEDLLDDHKDNKSEKKMLDNDIIDIDWINYEKDEESSPVHCVSVCEYENYIYSAFVLIGQAQNTTDAIIIKYDLKGTMIWKRVWGNDSFDNYFNHLVIYNDSIYIAGQTEKNRSYNKDAVLVKYTTDGELLWQKIWGGQTVDSANFVKVVDNDVYVTGIASLNSGHDLFLSKFDSRGDLIWTSTWDVLFIDEGNSLDIYNNSIFVSGSSYDTTESLYRYWFLLRYDLEGNLIWNITLNNSIHDITVDSSGIYATGGYAFQKFDHNGVLIKKLLIGDNNSVGGRSILYHDGCVYIGGSKYLNRYDRDVVLMKFDSGGYMIYYWDGGNETENLSDLYSIFVDNDNIYLSGRGFGAAYIMKINKTIIQIEKP